MYVGFEENGVARLPGRAPDSFDPTLEFPCA